MNKKRSFAQVCAMSTICMMLSVAYAATAPANPNYVFKRPVPTLVVTDSPTGPVDPGPNLSPNLFYSTDALTYGSVQVGTPSTKSFLITNIGNGPATLNPGVSLRNGAGVFGGLQTNCSSTLLPGANCTVSLTFSPLDAQVYTSFIDIISSNTSAKVINLSGEGAGQAVANLVAASGSSSNFGSVNVGSNKAETFIFSNTGNITDKGVYASLIGSNLSFSANSCGVAGSAINLAAGANCSMTVVYAPTAAGALSGGLSINSTATGQKTLSFTGSAIDAVLDLSSSALNYGSVNIGSSSTKSFLILNTGAAALTFNSAPSLRAGSSAAFGGLTSSCGASLDAGQNCSVSVVFSPTSSTTSNGTIDVATSVGSRSVSLTGVGAGATLNLTPASGSSNSYGVVEVSKTKANTFTFTNTGTVAATGVYASVSGAELSITSNTCGVSASAISLAAGSSCSVTVAYSPVSAGTLSGSLTVNTGAYGPFTLDLTGSAETASVVTSTDTLVFPSTEIGSTNTQIFSILNSSNVAVNLNGLPQLQSGGSSAFSNLTTDCLTTLNPGSTCNVAVEFKPVALGAATGNVLVNTLNAGNKTVGLSGTGTGQATVSLAPSGVATTDYGLVEINSNKSATFVYSNSGNIPATGVYASVTGAGYSITSNTCGVMGSPVSVGVGKGCSITVRFAPTAPGTGAGVLSVASSTPDTTETLNLTATIGQAVLDLSTPALDFGTLQVGTRSPLSFLVLNSGNVTANFSFAPSIRAGSSSEFNSLTTNCSTSLTPGATCSVSLYYQPTNTGADAGFVDIKSSNAANREVSLTGVGDGQAVASLSFDSGSSSDFGTVQVGSSKTSNLTFKNTGNTPATGVKAVLVGSDLTLSSNTCGTAGNEITLAANATCQISVTYAPSAVSSLSGASLSIQSSAASGTNSTTLTGSGAGAAIPGVSAAAGSSTNFGNILVGATSSQTFTFKNTGNIAATGVYAAVTGTGLSIASNNCGTQAAPVSIAASGSCNTTVTWNPASVGSLTGGNITIGGQSLNLTGTASQITMNIQDNAGAALSGLNFGTINADATKVIRLANSSVSPAALNVSNIVSNSAPYSVLGVGNALGGATCTSVTNMSIPAGGSCDVSVKMSSATNGTFNSGSITVTSNAQVSSPISGATSVNIPITGTVYIDQYSTGTNAYLTFEAPNGTSTFTDQSPVAPAITVNGVTASNSYAAAGATSGYFNGGSSIQYASSANYDVTQGDFTIEANIKATAMNTNSYIAVQRAVGSSTVGWNWRFTSTGAVQFWYTGGAVFTSAAGVVALNTPVKLAIQRVGNVFKLFKDGTLIATSTTIANGTSSNTALYVGVAEDGTSKFTGYMDEFRLTKGFARYDG